MNPKYTCPEDGSFDPEFTFPQNSILNEWEKTNFIVDEIKKKEKENARHVFIQELHRIAETYEREGAKFFIDKDIHNAHNAMNNARCLRIAANIMDGCCSNGG